MYNFVLALGGLRVLPQQGIGQGQRLVGRKNLLLGLHFGQLCRRFGHGGVGLQAA